ncbi:energy transducer TonB [Sulfuriferula nivalis]|uniref:Cell envelope biogenesis protein TonB n=1 Tax=Sulfuriferula nivalis TaxID=2675298 RepID=A0A809S8Q6_9PROT|nr:energy transducer TonB [Sulfuriferula nivalis]BBP00703.1 cell envelope biogenesis protein TonB [Sulfuriferula nivalis]
MRLIYSALALSIVAHAVVATWVSTVPGTQQELAVPVLQVQLSQKTEEISGLVNHPAIPLSSDIKVSHQITHIQTRRTPVIRSEPEAAMRAPSVEQAGLPAVAPVLAVSNASTAIPLPVPVQPQAVSIYHAPEYAVAYLQNPAPVYPPLARRMKLTGTVLLRVKVDENGYPLDIAIQQTCGSDMLDQAALDAVHHWKFVPARQGNTAVSAWVDVPVRFRMDM